MCFGNIPRLRDEMRARKAYRFCTLPWEYPFSLRGLVSLLLLAFLLPSCAIFKSKSAQYAYKIEREVARSPVFSKAFTGFTLLDPATGKTLADFNGERYFTPASNTKILTLATCLEVLGDSVPGVQYAYTANTKMRIKGTADPTFLHPNFINWQPVFQWLKEQESPFEIQAPAQDIPRFGAGWAWDDYLEPYSAERSDFPIYGNVIHFFKEGGVWKSIPNSIELEQRDIPKDLLYPINNGIYRGECWPVFILTNADSVYNDGFYQSIPFTQDFARGDFFSHFLQDTLDGSEGTYPKNLNYTWQSNVVSPWRTLYSTPLDTVLRRMMHQSDNFIAEQMLLVCAGVKFDLLKQDTMIKWMLDSTLNSLSQRPKWVDGSGLSRYNLMTPQSIAQVLLKLWKVQPQARLFSLFPAGGVSGTIADLYAGKDNKPYVFAKTGGMSGVHCLSGYIVCKSGKVLIFSFMHNNFVGSSKVWKVEMQRILEQTRDSF
jgi:D-alanyl-D-alanine carboxypeptidase/D-alanyl-D-alanine-endopeptidase (penicillin-binding protein 4)